MTMGDKLREFFKSDHVLALAGGSEGRGVVKEGVLKALRTLMTIEVQPSNQVIGVHETLEFIAIGRDYKKDRIDLRADEIEWSTLGVSAKSISKSGVLTASEFPGIATAVATSVENPDISGRNTVTVKRPGFLDVKLHAKGPVDAKNPTIVGGGHVDFEATAIIENFMGSKEYRHGPVPRDAEVKWKSSDTKVASIASTGAVTARAVVHGIGKTTITVIAKARDGGEREATTTLTVAPPGKAARKIKVNITALDHENAGINGKGIAVFHSDENDLKVTIERDIKGGTFSASATLMPKGWIEFHAIGKNGATPTSTARYEINDTERIWFTAVQKGGTAKSEAEHEQGDKRTSSKGKKKIDEKESKTLAEGEAGVNVKGVGISGKGSREWGNKESQEHSEENGQENSETHRNTTSQERPLGLSGFTLKQDAKGGGAKQDDE
jgi:hypothetical protein